jgi:hypothetical protein
MLPADESKVVETNTFEGEARTVTLAVALETEEVVRTNEVPRRTRKSWGMRLPPTEVGPKVDVTVPLVAAVNETTCHGAVHVEDARVPVLLQTEGRYEILGSVFSITIWSWWARTQSRWLRQRRNAKRREGPGNGGHGVCVVMQCKGARAAREGRGEDQTEEEQLVAIATVQALTPVWNNNIRESDTSRNGTKKGAG